MICLYTRFQEPINYVKCDLSKMEIKANRIDRKNIPESQKRWQKRVRELLVRKMIDINRERREHAKV